MRLRLAAYLAEAYDAQASENWRKKYDKVYDFHEGLARVELNDKWGFVNEKGKEVVKLKYDGVGYFHEGLAWVYLKDKGGHINQKGEVVVPLMYDYVWNFYEGLAWVRLNGKGWGFVNTEGKEVVPPGKYNDEDLKRIETYLRLGGNLDIILDRIKEETV